MKKQNNYAFIDSQNLNLGVYRDVQNKHGRVVYQGKKLDYKRFRGYLREKYGITRAYLFIGYLPTNTRLYTALQNAGFTLVFKTITQYTDEAGDEIVKGNVDTDIVLYAAAIVADEYEKAVFVSGDGDFLSLYAYMEEHDKLLAILVPNRHRYSKLLNAYRSKLRFVSDLAPLFKPIKKTRSGDRSATLGLPSHGDTRSVPLSPKKHKAIHKQKTEANNTPTNEKRRVQERPKK